MTIDRPDFSLYHEEKKIWCLWICPFVLINTPIYLCLCHAVFFRRHNLCFILADILTSCTCMYRNFLFFQLKSKSTIILLGWNHLNCVITKFDDTLGHVIEIASLRIPLPIDVGFHNNICTLLSAFLYSNSFERANILF